MMLDVDDLVAAWRGLEAPPHAGPCRPMVVLYRDGRPLLMTTSIPALAQLTGGRLSKCTCEIWGGHLEPSPCRFWPVVKAD